MLTLLFPNSNYSIIMLFNKKSKYLLILFSLPLIFLCLFGMAFHHHESFNPENDCQVCNWFIQLSFLLLFIFFLRKIKLFSLFIIKQSIKIVSNDLKYFFRFLRSPPQ
jgi:hypothetical protein